MGSRVAGTKGRSTVTPAGAEGNYLTEASLHEWVSVGFDICASAKWIRQGFTADEARSWASNGFKPKQAKAWAEAWFVDHDRYSHRAPPLSAWDSSESGGPHGSLVGALGCRACSAMLSIT